MNLKDGYKSPTLHIFESGQFHIIIIEFIYTFYDSHDKILTNSENKILLNV
jgi:hypothetical protein